MSTFFGNALRTTASFLKVHQHIATIYTRLHHKSPLPGFWQIADERLHISAWSKMLHWSTNVYWIYEPSKQINQVHIACAIYDLRIWPKCKLARWFPMDPMWTGSERECNSDYNQALYQEVWYCRCWEIQKIKTAKTANLS